MKDSSSIGNSKMITALTDELNNHKMEFQRLKRTVSQNSQQMEELGALQQQFQETHQQQQELFGDIVRDIDTLRTETIAISTNAKKETQENSHNPPASRPDTTNTSSSGKKSATPPINSPDSDDIGAIVQGMLDADDSDDDDANDRESQSPPVGLAISQDGVLLNGPGQDIGANLSIASNFFGPNFRGSTIMESEEEAGRDSLWNASRLSQAQVPWNVPNAKPAPRTFSKGMESEVHQFMAAQVTILPLLLPICCEYFSNVVVTRQRARYWHSFSWDLNLIYSNTNFFSYFYQCPFSDLQKQHDRHEHRLPFRQSRVSLHTYQRGTYQYEQGLTVICACRCIENMWYYAHCHV